MKERPSFGYTTKDTVEIDCWLSVHPGGATHFNRRPAVRLTAGEPALDRGERSINIKMTLPLALFEAPSIVARTDVAHPTSPISIDATALAQAVRSAIGMDVDLRVVEPGEQP
jgi:hypothetical protein